MPPEFWTDPLMYQGGSDQHRSARARTSVLACDEAWGIDFEGEVAVDDRRRADGDGRCRGAARSRCASLMLVNDVSLRNLIPAELAKGFGFLQSKPASGFSPVAVTPGRARAGRGTDGKVHLPLLVSTLNGAARSGKPNTGVDMTFSTSARLIAHLAKTRDLVAGSDRRFRHGLEQGGRAVRAARLPNGGIGYCVPRRAAHGTRRSFAASR
jgi:fumarylacetoacetate (FAA) hydrolase